MFMFGPLWFLSLEILYFGLCFNKNISFIQKKKKKKAEKGFEETYCWTAKPRRCGATIEDVAETYTYFSLQIRRIKAVFGCCKTFSGKYIFSGNANFRKRKMFSGVWLHFKKFSGKYFLVFGKEEGKHKSENTSHNPEKTSHNPEIINSRNVSSSTTAS